MEECGWEVRSGACPTKKAAKSAAAARALEHLREIAREDAEKHPHPQPALQQQTPSTCAPPPPLPSPSSSPSEPPPYDSSRDHNSEATSMSSEATPLYTDITQAPNWEAMRCYLLDATAPMDLPTSEDPSAPNPVAVLHSVCCQRDIGGRKGSKRRRVMAPPVYTTEALPHAAENAGGLPRSWAATVRMEECGWEVRSGACATKKAAKSAAAARALEHLREIAREDFEMKAQTEAMEVDDNVDQRKAGSIHIVLVDLDNWPKFFERLPTLLPHGTFVHGFYGGATNWQPPSGSDVPFRMLDEQGGWQLHPKCEHRSDAADFAIAFQVGQDDCKFHASVPFTIVSGDEGFLQMLKCKINPSRRLRVLNPHLYNNDVTIFQDLVDTTRNTAQRGDARMEC